MLERYTSETVERTCSKMNFKSVLLLHRYLWTKLLTEKLPVPENTSDQHIIRDVTLVPHHHARYRGYHGTSLFTKNVIVRRPKPTTALGYLELLPKSHINHGVGCRSERRRKQPVSAGFDCCLWCRRRMRPALALPRSTACSLTDMKSHAADF